MTWWNPISWFRETSPPQSSNTPESWVHSILNTVARHGHIYVCIQPLEDGTCAAYIPRTERPWAVPHIPPEHPKEPLDHIFTAHYCNLGFPELRRPLNESRHLISFSLHGEATFDTVWEVLRKQCSRPSMQSIGHGTNGMDACRLEQQDPSQDMRVYVRFHTWDDQRFIKLCVIHADHVVNRWLDHLIEVAAHHHNRQSLITITPDRITAEINDCPGHALCSHSINPLSIQMLPALKRVLNKRSGRIRSDTIWTLQGIEPHADIKLTLRGTLKIGEILRGLIHFPAAPIADETLNHERSI